MQLETIKQFIFKRINTGEEVAICFSTNTILCKFLADISTIFKEKFNIDKYVLAQGGTELAEDGKIYDFYDYPTRSTAIYEVFGDTGCFYIIHVE